MMTQLGFIVYAIKTEINNDIFFGRIYLNSNIIELLFLLLTLPFPTPLIMRSLQKVRRNIMALI